MKITSTGAEGFPLLWRSISLLLLLLTAAAGWAGDAGWQRLQGDPLGFSLEAPPGWAMQTVDGRGALLIGPEGGSPVEVVLWNALRPPATPETALAEHEAVLSRSLDYRRDEVTEIVTEDGRSPLMVSGRVRLRGRTEASVFGAYGEGDRHVIIGIFAPPDAITQIRDEVLERMMRSFRFEAVAGPAPPPAPEMPGPVADDPTAEDQAVPLPGEVETARAPLTIGFGPEAEPIGPETPATEVPWIRHMNPRGFSLSIPVDWEVTIEYGVIVCRPAVTGAAKQVLLIAPAYGTDPGAENVLRDVISVLPDLQLDRTIAIEQQASVEVIDVNATGGQRVRATWAHRGRRGLLVAAIASRAQWEQALPRMAAIAASFEATAWRVPDPEGSPRADEAQGMICELPAGWKVSGGITEDAGEPVIDLRVEEPVADGIFIAWQQPMRPGLRDLTPLLQSLGWREGESYSTPEGGAGLLIYRRRNPEDMVTDILLPRHRQGLTDVAVEATWSRAGAALLPGSEAAGSLVQIVGDTAAGRREQLYVAATARAEAPLAATCWEAAALQADAPEGRIAEAVEVLVRIVTSAEPAEEDSEQRRQRIRRIIDGARRSLEAIPGELVPDSHTRALRVLAAEVAPGGRLWEIPAGSLDIWRAPVEREDGGEMDLGGEYSTQQERLSGGTEDEEDG